METKANYVTVGAFTILVFLAGFLMVYWVARVDTGGQTAPLNVVIEGSVTGLGVGSLVKFNGIDVGKVNSLSFDQNNPRIVIARAVVNRDLPISSETKAVLGFTGLTGIAHIELEGGSIDRPNIFQMAAEKGEVATIEADPSTVNNLLATAQDIFNRTDSVLSELESFVAEARGPLATTLNNAATFSNALKDNADNIDTFLASVGSVGEALAEVSTKLDGTLKGVEGLLNAVDPAKVSSIVDNVDSFTADLRRVSQQIEGATEVVSKVANDLSGVGTRVNGTFDKVDNVLDAIPADDVRSALTDLAEAGKSARSALDQIDKLTAGIGDRGDDIETIITSTREMAERLNAASTRIDGTFEKVQTVLDAIPPEQVTEALTNLSAAGESARTALSEVAKLTEGLGERQEDIQSIISSTQEMTDRLNSASVRVDALLAKADNMLGSGEGDSIMTDARATLESFRNVADTLNARINAISGGLERFSGQGLQDVQSLVNETRRSVNRIEGAISDLERNPQRLIFGGEGNVKTYDGRERR